MAIPIFNLISNLWKSQPKHTMGLTRPRLAGINQAVFLSQWGMPEINVSLGQLQTFFKLNLPFSHHEFTETESLTAWIYKTRDVFLVFRRGKLIFHFKWSEFKERMESPGMKTDPKVPMRPSAFVAITLSLFA
jgi:hypothetical protein